MFYFQRLQMTNVNHRICDLQHRAIQFSTRRWGQIQHGMQICNEFTPGQLSLKFIHLTTAITTNLVSGSLLKNKMAGAKEQLGNLLRMR